MADYTNLAIQCFVKENSMKLSGYNNEWNKAMILADGTGPDPPVPDMGTGVQTVLVCPASVMDKEKQDMKKFVGGMHFSIMDEVYSPLGIVGFYKGQKVIMSADRDVFVVDMWDTFTDICLVRNEKGICRLADVQRIDYGYDRLLDGVTDLLIEQLAERNVHISGTEAGEALRGQAARLVSRMAHNRSPKESITFQGSTQSLRIKRREFARIEKEILTGIIASVNRMGVLHRVGKGKLLLGGRFFESMDAVREVRNRVPALEVFSYKPGDAAVLGAACYSHTKYGCRQRYKVDERKILYNRQLTMGNFCNLTAGQQKAYLDIRECVRNRGKEVTFHGESGDVLPVYSALRNDFPEVDIVWNYGEGSMWSDERNHTVTLPLTYYENGEQLLRQINDKVQEIIGNSLKGKQLSDMEILEEIYRYISAHYHYTKERLDDNSYPPYAYTLETLLRHGVCRGYAISLVYILRQLQIPVLYICGGAGKENFGRHAWNIVQLPDGTYRHLDMTWDLGRNNFKRYWLLDDIGMRARKHLWRVLDYPECAC